MYGVSADKNLQFVKGGQAMFGKGFVLGLLREVRLTPPKEILPDTKKKIQSVNEGSQGRKEAKSGFVRFLSMMSQW